MWSLRNAYIATDDRDAFQNHGRKSMGTIYMLNLIRPVFVDDAHDQGQFGGWFVWSIIFGLVRLLAFGKEPDGVSIDSLERCLPVWI